MRAIARFRPQAKILGFSADTQALRQIKLSWGAIPHHLGVDYHDENVITHVLNVAREAGDIRRGDLVCVLSGSSDYPGQATDSLQLIPIR